MANRSYIYTIIDPRTDKAFYVGQTADIKGRMIQHATTKASVTNPLIQEIKEAGLKPKFVIVEECDYGTAYHREKFWINKMRSEGCVLLNKDRKVNKHFDFIIDCKLTTEINL